MGFYENRVLPHLIERVCGARSIRPLRSRGCAGLSGDVVEIGFGSGLNAPHYPAGVTRVIAIEPSDVAWRMATERRSASATVIERSGLDGRSLPLDDASCDAALSTFTMCTIPDLPAALGELRRVLKPGGSLHFLEHGLAPDVSVRRWQHRLEPIQKRVAGGCHLTVPIVARLVEAGFTVTDVDEFYDAGAPKFGGAFSLGTAISA